MRKCIATVSISGTLPDKRESFADRSFFEIVQRVGQYDGYGALNAPARMASQGQRVAAPSN